MPTGQKLVLIEEAQPNERADWAIEVSALVAPPPVVFCGRTS